MFRELDQVVLMRDLPEFGLAAGDLGTVVHVYPGGRAYEVEFAALGGETVAVVTLPADAVRSISPREIAHVRAVV
ncbi:MAG: DUF4926 domain-containing protein [Sphaerobacter sp.]|nr:DUF4926 domain-containing protein [Sphaerobacter sp.]